MVWLKKGNTGSEVKKYQEYLSKLGYYKGVIDSSFGPVMEKAVIKFQQDNKLTVDGIIGDQTARIIMNRLYPPQPGQYKIYLLDQKVGGDVLQNPEIAQNIPQTAFSKQIFDLCKQGSVVVELGRGATSKKLMIEAGIHGNEEEANIAAMRYLEIMKGLDIPGKIYIIPFAIPKDTAKNSRTFNGTDPNRTANQAGTPGNVLINFAASKGIKYILDVHSGGGVNVKGLVFYRYFDEPSWFSYIQKRYGCTGQKIAGIIGSIRKVANGKSINCITLEVERDTQPTSTMAVVDYNMLHAAAQYLGFP